MSVDLTKGAIVEYIFRDMKSGEFWIDFVVDGKPYGSLGPFDSEAARQRASDDMADGLRSLGAVDIGILPQ